MKLCLLVVLAVLAGSSYAQEVRHRDRVPVNFCVIGKLYAAVQGGVIDHCRACGAYLQCIGSQNAVNQCKHQEYHHHHHDDDDDHLQARNGTEVAAPPSVESGSGDHDDLDDIVRQTTDSEEWEHFLEREIGIEENPRAAKNGRKGRNCYALYGMFRGCVIPSLCLGFSNI